MFRFKICSAVEFWRIKLWLHQKTEGRDQYFNRWVYYATKTFFNWVGNSVLIFDVSPQSVTSVFFLHVQLSWPTRCLSDRMWYQQCDSTHSLSGGWCQRPCGHGWGWGGFLKTALFPSDISFKSRGRKGTTAHAQKMSPRALSVLDAPQKAGRTVRRFRELCLLVLFKATGPGADCGGITSLVVRHL